MLIIVCAVIVVVVTAGVDALFWPDPPDPPVVIVRIPWGTRGR
jgi:hypothetical protein